MGPSHFVLWVQQKVQSVVLFSVARVQIEHQTNFGPLWCFSRAPCTVKKHNKRLSPFVTPCQTKKSVPRLVHFVSPSRMVINEGY
jgi:hypothetical protein